MTVPLQTAMANLVNNGFSKKFTLSGWIDNSTPAKPIPQTPITGSGTLTIGSPSAATFKGASVLQGTVVMAGTMTADGKSTPISSTSTNYYNPGNYTTVVTVVGGETFTIAPYTYPATVKAGSTGSLGNGTTGEIILGANFSTTSTTSYAVASDTATSLLITFLSTIKPFIGGETQTQTVYRISTFGDISPVSIVSTESYLGKVYKTLTYTF